MLLLVLHGVAVLLLVLHGLVGDVGGPGGPVGGVGLADGGRGLQVGSSSKFLIFLILFLLFSGGAVLLLVLHGLVDDVRGPEGPVGDEGLADGGRVVAAEASGAVSFLNSFILFLSVLLIGSPRDGVPPGPGLGADLWLQLLLSPNFAKFGRKFSTLINKTTGKLDPQNIAIMCKAGK